jgi:membrane protein required for colicin V production
MDVHEINWIDYGILSLIGVSVIMGIFRGFVREALSLITWITALVVGVLYCETVAGWFSSRIPMVGLRLLIAFILLILTVLIIGGILSYLITRLIKFTGFGVTDRIVGIMFGLGRGLVVIAIAIMIVSPTPFAKDKLWKESTLIPRIEPLAIWLKNRIPEDIMKKIHLEKVGVS